MSTGLESIVLVAVVCVAVGVLVVSGKAKLLLNIPTSNQNIMEELIAEDERKKKASKSSSGTSASSKRVSRKSIDVDQEHDSQAATEDIDIAALSKLRPNSNSAATLSRREKRVKSDDSESVSIAPAEKPKASVESRQQIVNSANAKVEAKKDLSKQQDPKRTEVIKEANVFDAKKSKPKEAKKDQIEVDGLQVQAKKEPVNNQAKQNESVMERSTSSEPVKITTPGHGSDLIKGEKAAAVDSSLKSQNKSQKSKSIVSAKIAMSSNDLLNLLTELPIAEKSELIAKLLDGNDSWSEVGREDPEKKILRINEENNTLKSQVTSYKNQLESTRSEVADLKSAIKEFLRRDKENAEKIGKLEREVIQTRDMARASKKEAEEANARTLDLHQHSTSLQLMQTEYKNLEDRHTQVLHQYQEAIQKERAAQEELHNIQAYLQQFRQQSFEEQSRHHEELQNLKGNHQVELTKIIHVKDEEIQGARSELDNLRKAIQALQLQLADRDALNQNMRRNSMDLNAELDRAHRALEEKAQLSDELLVAQSRAIDLQNQVKDTELRAAAEIASLKHELRESQVKLEASFAQQAAAGEQNKNSKQEAEARVSDLEKQVFELETSNKDVEKLRLQLTEAHGRISELEKNAVLVQSSEVEATKSKLRLLEEENQALKSAVSTTSRELESVLNEARELRSALDTTAPAVEAAAKAENEISLLRSQVIELERKVADGGDSADLKRKLQATSEKLFGAERRAEEAASHASMMASVALAVGETAARNALASMKSPVVKSQVTGTMKNSGSPKVIEEKEVHVATESKTVVQQSSNKVQTGVVERLTDYVGVLAEYAKTAQLEKTLLQKRCAALEAAGSEE